LAVALALADLGVKQIIYRTENAGAAMADGFGAYVRTPQAPLVCRRSTMGTTDRSKKSVATMRGETTLGSDKYPTFLQL
jgi:hypothetical protein